MTIFQKTGNDAPMNKLMLIDGNSIANRAFYALPLLSNDEGQYTNAVYGFTNMLLKMLEEEQPTHVLVAFDAGKQTFRHTQYEQYKGTRMRAPEEMGPQFAYIQEVLDALSVRHYELHNYEADDIIGTLAKEADREGWRTHVVTGDKDMLQLVSERVHVALTRKGISEVEYYDPEQLKETYGLQPSQIIDLKGLMGDASDNIPGVPGVGEKTALKLLRQFPSVENVYEHIADVSGKKLKEKLNDNKEQAFLSKKLATIMRDAPIEIALDDTAYPGFDTERAMPVFQKYAFSSLIERLGGEVAAPAEEEAFEPDVIQITSPDSKMWEEALRTPVSLYVEVLSDRYHNAPIEGLAIAHEDGIYAADIDVARKSAAFTEWLEDSEREKWVYDAKRTQVVLKWHGLNPAGIRFDVFLAAYLLNPSEAADNIAQDAKTYANLRIPGDDQVYGKGAKKSIPEDRGELLQHIGRKAYAVQQLKQPLQKEMQTHDLMHLLLDLELPLAQVLSKMEAEGVRVDKEQLKKMGQDLNASLASLTKDIYSLAGGVEFNINSPKQLGEILFDKLNLPVIKKTKTGYSTSADVLEKLEPQHEIIGKLLHYRQLEKLRSTYIEGLLKEIVEETGKVHSNFRQTIAATGRLSSTDPNLQNIPIRLEEGRKIRKAFVPVDKDHVMLAADYSQIELRILAHLSADESLVDAFRGDRDVHTKTAMDVFHVAEDEVTSLMRRQAKAVNFGIIYGISDYGLSQNLNIPRKEAKAFIERYFDSYPNVKKYMDLTIQQAKKDGH
jgi:DNA polymerase I